jgi:16S rRNA (guanine(966)-N(2))-methyltransferase RsmD
LDLYAGTGAVGIEALSRGAEMVTFVESDPNAIQIMRKNLKACGMLDHAEVRIAPFQTFLRQPQSWTSPYDVLFADPPYADREAVELVLSSWRLELLSSEAVMVIEQDVRAELPAETDCARLVRRYDYGDTALFLYGKGQGEAPGGSPKRKSASIRARSIPSHTGIPTSSPAVCACLIK